jgi:hypothetical protein
MHFPHLRSLTVGLRVPQIPSASNHFTEFVLAHNLTLEDLDMTYPLTFDDSSPGALREGSLPHLRSFEGSASTVTVMIQARLNCLKTTLRRLVVRLFGGIFELKRMFDAMLAFQRSGGSGSAGCFSVLREIKLDIYRCEDMDMIHAVGCIQKCARCFGSSLEVMTLMLPHVRITAEMFSKLFGRFDKLRVIRLEEGSFVGRRPFDVLKPDIYKHNSAIVESYVRSIASNCWALEEITVRRYHHFVSSRDERWLVTRCQNPTVLGRREVCDVIRQAVI